jgi:hypothetical protein
MGPSRLYWTAGKHLYGGWNKKALLLPFLICFGCGMAINNTKAVLEAIFRKRSDFIRTPKQGNQEKKCYVPTISSWFFLELATGIWCLIGMFFYFTARQYLIGHFLLIYAIGFLYVGGLSFFYHLQRGLQ